MACFKGKTVTVTEGNFIGKYRRVKHRQFLGPISEGNVGKEKITRVFLIFWHTLYFTGYDLYASSLRSEKAVIEEQHIEGLI
jgi:hypothetical protein